jgi:tripartite-type tricarboxylate transporter receptor subunit TctC
MVNALKRGVLAVMALVLTAGLAVNTASAQGTTKYPERTIRLVIPYPPGGPTDLTARVVAAEMSKTIGQPVVVDNRAGASGMIGSEAVARSEPDGYTLLGNASIHVINPSVYNKMTFDAIEDFVPISQLAQVPLVLVVPANSPIKSVKDLVAYAKQKGGKLNFGSAGTASAQHLAGESFKRVAGIDMQHIPYKGSAPALQDLAGGQIDLMFDSMPSATPLINSGKLRAIAVTTLTRAKARPDLPTIAESGYPTFDISTWYGYWAPKGTPPEIVELLAKNVQTALKNPQVIDTYQKMGAEPVGSSPAAFSAYNRSEAKKWAEIVKASGATRD